MNDPEITYQPDATPRFPLLDRMVVERGSKADWDLLHHLHYKTEGKPVGAQYWRLDLDGETVGVTALTLPRPLLRERHRLIPDLKPDARDTRLSNTWRYKWINANVRVVGRIVVDTMYRGVGASYRFQNLVARMSGYPFVEIQSAMSKYNLFAQKAGFRFVRPERSKIYEKGVRFFRENFEAHPADTEGLLREIEAMRPRTRERVLAATRRFYYANSTLEKTGKNRTKGTSRVDELPVPELIRQLQQLILASPLYGIYTNPDAGRKMPDRLPLTTFDLQPPEEKLRI